MGLPGKFAAPRGGHGPVAFLADWDDSTDRSLLRSWVTDDAADHGFSQFPGPLTRIVGRDQGDPVVDAGQSSGVPLTRQSMFHLMRVVFSLTARS